MRTSFLMLVSSLSALLTGCGDEPPLGASKKGCPNLDRSNLDGELVADSCFQLERDAFGFENYSGGANLRVEEMIEVFGDGVCRSDGAKCSPGMATHGHCNETCVLTNKAMDHMSTYNDFISAGHCDGMAAMSQLIYSKTISGPDNGPTSELLREEALEREIARWRTTQITVQQRGAGVYEDKEPSEVASYLDRLWVHKSAATLWVYYVKNGHTAAHALTPYAITSPSEGTQRVYVYDSNEPQAIKYVELHLGSGEWSYDVDPVANPKVQAGSAASPPRLNKLRFVANEARVGRYCWFCENTFANVTQNLITLGGDAPARVLDKTQELARKAEDGTWSTADGIELHFPLANLDDSPLPSLVFEPTEPYQIEFAGSADGERGDFLVSVPGDITLGVHGIQAPAGKTGIIGTAMVDPRSASRKLEYEARDAGQVTLQWSTQRTAADQTMTDHESRVTMNGPGAAMVSLQDDAANHELIIGFRTTNQNFGAYALKLEIVRVMPGGAVQTDEFVRPVDGQNVTYKVKTNSTSNNVDVAMDINSDGTIDMSETWMPSTLDLAQGMYTLKTEFQGDNICLEGNDPVSPMHGGNAFMNDCLPASGQQWRFIPIAGTSYHQLQTVFLGATKCFDGLAKDVDGQLLHGGAAFMNDCNANAPGQQWSVFKGALGRTILQAPLVGPNLCLEGNEAGSPVRDGSAFLDVCRDVAGQQWALTKLP